MPRGGDKRHPKDCTCGHCPRIGRPKHPVADSTEAGKFRRLKESPKGHPKDCRCLECRWFGYTTSHDQRIAFDADKYLWDQEKGKARQTVNHLHDKPIEMNVTVSLADAIQKARKRVSA